MSGHLQQDKGGATWRTAMWGGAAALLSLPFFAMQANVEGVAWTGSDFVVMGVLLATCCGIVELGAALSRSAWYRAGFAVAVLTGFLTVWVNLAVGMILSENNVENLVFAGVLAIAALGALLARFRARGMAWAMVAAAVAMGACAVFAATIDSLFVGALVAGFCVPWLAAAILFRNAARTEA